MTMMQDVATVKGGYREMRVLPTKIPASSKIAAMRTSRGKAHPVLPHGKALPDCREQNRDLEHDKRYFLKPRPFDPRLHHDVNIRWIDHSFDDGHDDRDHQAHDTQETE